MNRDVNEFLAKNRRIMASTEALLLSKAISSLEQLAEKCTLSESDRERMTQLKNKMTTQRDLLDIDKDDPISKTLQNTITDTFNFVLKDDFSHYENLSIKDPEMPEKNRLLNAKLIDMTLSSHKNFYLADIAELEVVPYSDPFKTLYRQALKFVYRVILEKIQELTGYETGFKELKIAENADAILQSTAHTPGLTHFSQVPAKKEIDWNKDVNTCDEAEQVIRFRAHYALQCDHEYFVWPFSTMRKKVKNHEEISLAEIKLHALADPKSRTAIVTKKMGLNLN